MVRNVEHKAKRHGGLFCPVRFSALLGNVLSLTGVSGSP